MIVKGLGALPSLEGKATALTIGNFDGIHLGHQSLLNKLLSEAKSSGLHSALYTFRPHPQEVFRPTQSVELIQSYEEKLNLLQEYVHEGKKFDFIVEELFSQDFFSLSARDFFVKVVVNGFHCRVLLVGHDFAFGKNREGTHEVLAKLCDEFGVKLHILPAIQSQGVIVSSTLLRKELLQGHIELANQWLYKPFFYQGVVEKGDQRGRTIGFPTANLRVLNKLQIQSGVYQTQTLLNGTLYPSITNIGSRPTFKEALAPIIVETHLISQNSLQEFYGVGIEVSFVKFIRAEKKFSSVDELKKQIELDLKNIKA